MKSLLLNPHLINLVKILSDGQYHDGTLMGEQLNLTRSAIWKNIKKLKKYGIAIHSIKNKGYALLEPLTLLDPLSIGRHSPVSLVEVFEYVNSTNDHLKQFVYSPQLRFCLAESQTKGRGRLSRDWYSPFAENIYLSCMYPFHCDLSDLAGLSLVVSLAVVKAIMSYPIIQPVLVKWPNDVICDNKKLAGSLIEIQSEANDLSCAVIGIGMNVNMLHNKIHPISQPWISLRELTGYYLDRNDLCIRLISSLLTYLEKFAQQGFVSFLDEWNMVDGLRDQAVNLKSVQLDIQGQVKGINEYGHLLLKIPGGKVQAFSFGEIEKIRKI